MKRMKLALSLILVLFAGAAAAHHLHANDPLKTIIRMHGGDMGP